MVECEPTGHVRHLRRGKLVHDGTGQEFWFRPLSAVLSEVPVDDRELPLLFHSHTVDYPTPTDHLLAWFVREAWPSAVTGTAITEGALAEARTLTVAVESDHLVAFGDGMEADALTLG